MQYLVTFQHQKIPPLANYVQAKSLKNQFEKNTSAFFARLPPVIDLVQKK